MINEDAFAGKLLLFKSEVVGFRFGGDPIRIWEFGQETGSEQATLDPGPQSPESRRWFCDISLLCNVSKIGFSDVGTQGATLP